MTEKMPSSVRDGDAAEGLLETGVLVGSDGVLLEEGRCDGARRGGAGDDGDLRGGNVLIGHGSLP